MTVRRLAVLVGRAALFGLVLAALLGDEELVSIEIWLATTGVLVVAGLLRDVVRVAAVEPARMAVAWTWQRRRPVYGEDQRPRDLRTIEGIVTSAQHNSRAHASELRPRLTALADHALPIHRAIDPRREPTNARELLGDVGWLIDPEVVDRTPTVGEIDTFLDIILDEDSGVARPPRPGSD
jgi:hypothetical protein